LGTGLLRIHVVLLLPFICILAQGWHYWLFDVIWLKNLWHSNPESIAGNRTE